MIYCVEDERNIRELLVYTLHSTGFEAKGLENGEQLFEELGNLIPDLILLDIMLPGDDGYTILAKIRQMPEVREVPVIMVTAKGAEFDKVKGLDLGADDYITKPFGIMELLSRVKAVLRRSHVQKPEQQQVLSAHDLTIDLNQRTVVYLETEIVLTYKEFELLSYLVRNRGSAISRDRLLEQVWGFSYEGETRTVDAHVKTLRQKLEAAGCTNLIHTVRGYGYKIGG